MMKKGERWSLWKYEVRLRNHIWTLICVVEL